ncbi:MAG: hypothetical protein GC161_08255 [Planctomycetaceae bacterium]|nr:hypothetical protein [Planctomycetaceae bacterium]
MKLIYSLLLLAPVAYVLPASALSADAKVGDTCQLALFAETLRGEIQSIDGDNITIAQGETTKVVRVSERTKFTLDGEASDRAKVLRVGAQVSVESEDGVATSVDAKKEALLLAETARGEITAVTNEGFTLKVGERTVEVRTNADTKYMLDGAEVTRAELLRSGAEVSVDHEDGLATVVNGKKAQ